MSALPPAPAGAGSGLTPLYDEAAAIAEASPAAATALMRLLVRALLVERGRPGRHLADDVAALVEHGAPVTLLRQLDLVGLDTEASRRPGEIRLTDGHGELQAITVLAHLVADQVPRSGR